MNKQLGDPVYNCSENGTSNNREVLFLETDNACMKDGAPNLLFNSFEIMNFSDEEDSSQNFSSCSLISYSESDENHVSTSRIHKEIQSTRETLTFEWVKTMSSVDSPYEFDSSLDCSNNSVDFKTDSEMHDSTENNSLESSPEIKNDDSIIFMEHSKDLTFEHSSELTFCFADAVTEENCDSGFSFSTRGSLADCIDDDFLEDNDFDLVFSTSSLSATELPPDWSDIVGEASELSQGFENEVFVDYFDLSIKRSKALRRVNERWEYAMCDVDEKPREPVKVKFASSNLVTVHCYENAFEENQPYGTYVLDRLRFQNRIEELSKLLTPILSIEHRANVSLRNSLFVTHN